MQRIDWAGTQAKKHSRRHGLGWRPDLPDYRDKLFATIARAPRRLPSVVDLRSLCSRVENQGSMNSCTANALVAALEFLENKNHLPCINLSRLFVYYNERVLEHDVDEDNGAYLRDGIKTLVHQGVCTEAKWPYSKSKLFTTPSTACYKEAADHQVTSYHRILSLNEMRQCLAEGFPFVFGFTVYTGFYSDRVGTTGVIDMPGPNETVEGGHAVLAVGYDDRKQRFLIRNSWGSKWGMKGYFAMPYEYLSDRNLSDDFWTLRRGENF